MYSSGSQRFSLGLIGSLLALAGMAFAPGCAGDGYGDDDPQADPDAGIEEPAPNPEDYPEGESVALLEVYAMDIWAQFLPDDATLTVSQVAPRDEGPLTPVGFPLSRYSLVEAGDYSIELQAPEHRTLTMVVHFDGTSGLNALTITDGPNAGEGASLSHEMRAIHPDEDEVPVHTLYLGLRHKWFSAQARPARRGNRVDLLMDGEQAWGAVHEAVSAAQESVDLSTWWWESNFELVRDADEHVYQSEAERRPNTVLKTLENSPAYKRVLVGQIWHQDGLLDWLTVDSDLRDHGDWTGDDFEFMGQANETYGIFWFQPDPFDFGDRVRAAHTESLRRAFDAESPIESEVPGHEVDLNHWPIDVEVQSASYHQKFLVVDSDIAFVGGMNLRRVDWDTSQHLVFEPRRMLFDSTEADRVAVVDHEEFPDTGPRKDYMVRIEGPAAQDVAEVFKQRWDLARSEGVDYSENTTSFEVERNIAPREGGVQVQITTTLPDPFWEHGITESWLNAISNAQHYIFIEDQYFRAPLLNDAIVARMTEVPELKLIVITKPVSEWTDPGCAWTHASNALFKSLFPDRYMMLQLRSFGSAVTWGWDETEGYFDDMDTHSKMLIVDDVFMSVGSANKNGRSMIYDGEMNVAVLDQTWVTEQRRRIMANILPPGTTPSDNVYVWTEQLRDAAEWNDYVYANWDDEGFDISLDGDPMPAEYIPEGFVYSLDFRTVEDCLIEDIGPDLS